VFVSDSRKLVFVHIQKTGGVTVQRLLQKKIPDIRTIVARHAFASQGMEELDDWDEYFKFAFARNPWDRLVSWYTMIRTAQQIKARPWNKLWSYAQDNSSTFEEFIRNCTDEVRMKEGVSYSFAYNQLDYITDENGDLLIDFVGRVENFETDIRKVLDVIGIKQETIPRNNSSTHKHYSEFYTPETERIVRERFKRDIEYFGYEFESPHVPRDARLTVESPPFSEQGLQSRTE
jgi:chondroitin 4-sulfotransferase 11